MAVLTGLLGALASVGSAIAAGGGAAGAAAGLASAAAGIAGAALSGKKGGGGGGNTAGQTPTETSKVSPMTKAQLLAGNPNVLSSADTATSAGRGRLLGN